MNKWLKNFQNMPGACTDKPDTPKKEPVTMSVLSVSDSGIQDKFLEGLTSVEGEAYQEYIDLMTGPKYGMTLEKAHKETMVIMKKNMAAIRSRQIREFFLSDAYKPKAKKHGFTV